MYNLKGAFSHFSFLIQGIVYCMLSSRLKAAEGGIWLFVKVLYKYCTTLYIQHSAFIWRLAHSSVHQNLILKDNVTGNWPIKTANILRLNHCFPRKMTCEEQPQKFYTAGFSLRILVAGERCDVTGEYLKEAPCLNNKQS